MQNINEDFHIPDPDAGYELIRNIYNKIYSIVMNHLYSSKDIANGDDDEIKGKFVIDKDINPSCKWLANDNIFDYRIVFGDFENDAIISSFDESKPGIGEIKPGDPIVDMPDTIHYGRFHMDLFINDTVFKTCLNGIKNVNEQLNKIKSSLRHEIEHAYQEIGLQNRFKIREESDKNSDEYIEPKEFIEGYDELSDAIRSLRGVDNEEKQLLYVLYRANYLERDAHISGFFQRLLNDVERRFSLNTKDSYYEYRQYKEDLDFIKNFKDINIFSKYKDIISKLFGNTASKSRWFHKKMRQNIMKAINKLDKIYDVMEDFCKGSPRPFNLDDARKQYYKRLSEASGMEKYLSEDDYPILEVMSKDILRSKLNGKLTMTEYVFEALML